MSYECYTKLQSAPGLNLTSYVNVVSATGSNLMPLGHVELDITIGNTSFKQRVIVCKNLQQSLIIGLDMQRCYRIGTSWTSQGHMYLHQDDKVLVSMIQDGSEKPHIRPSQNVRIPARTAATITTQLVHGTELESAAYEVSGNENVLQEYPGLTLQPMIHLKGESNPDEIPILLINQSFNPVYLTKDMPVGHLQLVAEKFTVNSITDEEEAEEKEDDKLPITPPDSKLISSPADIESHRKIKLPDIDLSPEIKRELEELCGEYEDIFSANSADIGHTKLIVMDIDTGNSPPVAQKPYNLPLKHLSWVKEELETLEKAGIIARSVSPWASPIVIVPKRSQPGEPPQRRLCVDYRAINSLLPSVKKAHSKAQGVLTLVPLPKIDELYARLLGSKVYSTIDCTSGYHHIGLSKSAQKKSAFVTPFGKFEYRKTPFGLAQAPAYFQALVYDVLKGLDFCFGYLDDILIFSKNEKEHLKHLKIVFDRLRSAGLKLKMKKCSFFKTQLHYLGHLVSGEGIQALPEKVEAVEKMPIPRNPKEVRQFLGLTGYYRKFVPHYADIARPLSNLTKKKVPFVWTEECHLAFEELKACLIRQPILVYPDPNLPYVLFTDASKYAWSAVLTQERQVIHNGKETTVLQPITFLSGLFHGSQNNWAALTKEAYAIYIAVKKLRFYLEDADIILRSDHLPLKKFLNKVTLNAKVNNWAVELSTYRIRFEFIKGIKNTLADTLSRLIDQGLTEPTEPEPAGEEFGYYVFDTLPDIEINQIRATIPQKEDEPPSEFSLNMSFDKLIELQAKDPNCHKLIGLLQNGKLQPRKPYFIDDNGILCKQVYENDETFEVTVVPKVLTGYILHQAHDTLGHNGTLRLYHFVKRMYYWKGLRTMVDKHVKHCLKCRQLNLRPQKYAQLHLEIPCMPMHMISMDLIGEFRPQSSHGNSFGLTVIDMLTNYVWCIPIQNKTADEVVSAYLKHVYSQYGGSMKILTDNGSEFKNKLFAHVAEELSMKHIFSSPYYPRGNGRIENFHNFLKTCIKKHVSHSVEWDDVTHLACAAYNFVPNQHSKESAFFLMFGRDAYTPIAKLLNPKIRYVGNERGLLALDVLRGVYALAIHNLKLARERQEDEFKTSPLPDYVVGDLVLVRKHVRSQWDPKYDHSYRITKIHGRQVELQSQDGKVKLINIQDIRPQYPVDDVLQHLPDYRQFGRAAKYVAHPNLLKDLGWDLNLKELPDVKKNTPSEAK